MSWLSVSTYVLDVPKFPSIRILPFWKKFVFMKNFPSDSMILQELRTTGLSCFFFIVVV